MNPHTPRYRSLSDEAVSTFFLRNANIRPFAKVGLKGFDSGGKSLTAVLIAIGLAKMINTEKPVAVVDSEQASQFFLDEFEKAGLSEPFYRPTTSFADLKQIMQWMDEGLSDILVIDQTAAFHKDFEEMYKQRPTLVGRSARTRLEIEDRMVIKDEWKDQFSRPFVEGRWHGIFCARAAYVWENEFNEEAGRRESFTAGTKMRGDNESGHDPDLVVLMEFDEAALVNRAKITKDRSRTIHGKVFDNPTFETFKPYFDKVLQNPSTKSVTPTDQAVTFTADDLRAQEYRRKCQIAVEEIEGLLLHAIPGRAKEDTQHKIDIIQRVFGTHSDKEWQQNRPLHELIDGKQRIQDELVQRGFAEYIRGVFHVRGTPPISDEALAGGIAKGHEQITPAALAQAQDSIDALQTKQDRRRVVKFIQKPQQDWFVLLAQQSSWTDVQLQAFLQKHNIASVDQIPEDMFNGLYMDLMDQDIRVSFTAKSPEIDGVPV